MSELVPFVFEHEQETTPIRTLRLDGKPWFVTADVCRALGLEDNRVAVRRLKPAEKGEYPIPTPGGVQQMGIINRNGLTRLVMRSDKPQATAFQDWIIEDVIPAIINTGKYELATAAITPTEPDLLSALSGVEERLGRRIDVLGQKLGHGRHNFSKESERYVYEGHAKHGNCECQYCNDTIIVTRYGQPLGNSQLHHANGNRLDNRTENCMAACDDCHERIHYPSRADHIPATEGQSVATAFHRKLRQKAGLIKAPDPTATKHWDFRAATQADMGFPTLWRKP